MSLLHILSRSFLHLEAFTGHTWRNVFCLYCKCIKTSFSRCITSVLLRLETRLHDSRTLGCVGGEVAVPSAILPSAASQPHLLISSLRLRFSHCLSYRAFSFTPCANFSSIGSTWYWNKVSLSTVHREKPRWGARTKVLSRKFRSESWIYCRVEVFSRYVEQWWKKVAEVVSLLHRDE
jgi:hypothetical protein